MFDEQIPRAAGMRRGRTQVADRDADHKRPIEARMREKDVAACIYRVEQPLVEAVELRRGERNAARLRAKAHGRERHGCEALEVRMLIHERSELPGETDVLAQHL